MPQVKPLTPEQAKNSLAQRLAGRVDKVRQFATNLGVRPYRVFLTWIQYAGEERGDGTATLYKRIELLPTPKVTAIDALTYVPQSIGSLSIGSVRVERVSATYSDDMLRGNKIGEDELPENIEFFYELQLDGRVTNPAQRSKYRLASPPYLQAGKVSYTLILERIDGSDLDRDGNIPPPDCLPNPGLVNA